MYYRYITRRPRIDILLVAFRAVRTKTNASKYFYVLFPESGENEEMNMCLNAPEMKYMHIDCGAEKQSMVSAWIIMTRWSIINLACVIMGT